jgi:hypothetical protein
MNRTALEHILRAAAAVTNEPDIVVVGSQALLGQYPNAPDPLLSSIEADVFPRADPAKSILIASLPVPSDRLELTRERLRRLQGRPVKAQLWSRSRGAEMPKGNGKPQGGPRDHKTTGLRDRGRQRRRL